MASYVVTEDELTAVADAIREKGGTSAQLEWPDGYVDAIGAISGGGVDIPTFTVTWDSSWSTVQSVTCDKTYAECYALLHGGDTSSSIAAVCEEEAVGDTWTDNFGMSGMARSNALRYTAIDAGKPVFDIDYTSSGTLTFVSPSAYDLTLTATSNGTYTPTLGVYGSVTVAVPAPTPSLQSKTATPTTSQQVITADSGYDGLSQVTVSAMPSGTAGTPTATKGTVSNHAVSVTPSVTNTTGYITGGIKTGTAVTVSASELVSGSETKTANGTYDVTNIAELVVNVSGGGGASNLVTGKFTCQTTTGASQTVTIPYSGSGYPVAVMVYPSEGGYNSAGALYSLVHRYVVTEFFAVKAVPTSSPTYATSGTQNQAHVVSRYKSSTSSATSYSSGASTTANFYSSSAPTASSTVCLRFSDAKTMKVFVAASSYGFHAGTEYTYVIQYSS